MPADPQVSAGGLIRDARERAGLTQTQLAAAAGTSQGVISAYESGRRQPTVPTLQRLIRAADAELVLEARSVRVLPRERLAGMREQVMEVAERVGLTDVRVFGSVARGEDTMNSDVDLLVDLPEGMTLWGLGAVTGELSDLLGVPVDLVPASDLKPGVRETVMREAKPL